MKKNLITLALLFFITTAAIAQDTLKFSKKQVSDDISFLFKNAADIHPYLNHKVSVNQLSKKVDSLVATLPDSLSTIMAFRAFATATAFIDEGHTSINIPKWIRNDIKSGKFKGIPLKVDDYSENCFSASIAGTNNDISKIKVRSINGKSAESIFEAMVALRGGLLSLRKINALRSFRFYLSAIGIHQPYTINYTDQQTGSAKTAIVNEISEQDYLAAIAKPADTRSYTFAILDKNYGYLNFKEMRDYDRFVIFCDSVFRVIDQNHLNKLVIDLRENGGGNSGLGRYLLNYLSDKPYRMAGGAERKVSQQFKDQIQSPANKQLYQNSGLDEYLKMQNGSFLEFEADNLEPPADIPNKFKGKVCFLIGPYTFSSANMLAATIKDFKIATLIGEPTGEPANDYGEVCSIKLPQTGLVAFTSTTLWIRPNGNKADSKPIEPDYFIERKTAEDNVLKFSLNWLDK